MPGTEESGRLAGIRDAVDHLIGERDPGDLGPSEFGQDGAEGRMVVGPGTGQRLDRVRQRARVEPGQDGVARIIMLLVVVADAPDHREPVPACWAIIGMCSQTEYPATLVAIGRNSPRTWAGASGLRSNVS